MSQINDELIRILRLNTPEKGNTVDLLMDIVPLGKEAAYRRLRGEIPFTLDEACLISKKLNLSLDRLLQMNRKASYSFQLSSTSFDKPLESIYEKMDETSVYLTSFSDVDNSISYRAYRCIPFEFLFKYNSLSRVYMYILLYQLNKLPASLQIQEVQIPEEVYSLNKKMSASLQKIDSILILDKHIIIDFVELIKYFNSMGIILEQDIETIKKDMLSMIDDLEKCALTGLSLYQRKMDIYIAHISFDCTYAYMEGDGYKGAAINLYYINHLSCDNPEVADNHKAWIKSLIRFSTLISVSGELQRNEYFYNQRKIINEML